MLDLKITTILIEPDKQSLKDTTLVLKKFNELSIVGKALTGEQGLALCQTFLPQLIFINIALPDISGFEVAQILRNRNLKSEIIFLAKNNQYAYESLIFEPIDYFALPLDAELVSELISRFNQKLKNYCEAI